MTVTAVYTKARSSKTPAIDAHPGVRYHKWQAYDRFREAGPGRAFATKESRRDFLSAVARGIELNEDYRNWHLRFTQAIRAVSVERDLKEMSWQTEWRLVIGWSSNPTLEGGGLVLHPVRGFPQLPGSAVRGLVKATAEAELLKNAEGGLAVPCAPRDLPPSPPAGLASGLERAEFLRIVFGNLSSESGDGRPATALERLEEWKALIPAIETPPEWAETLARLERLTEASQLRGLLTCFDAVPAPPTAGTTTLRPVEVDVLTPHYKVYYDDVADGGTAVDPSDDGDPNPVNFLAVKTGIRFEFRWALDWPRETSLDDSADDRRSGLGGRLISDVQGRVLGWLASGLGGLGLGAKTSAGYGYFNSPAALTVASPAPRSDPRHFPRRNPNVKRPLH